MTLAVSPSRSLRRLASPLALSLIAALTLPAALPSTAFAAKPSKEKSDEARARYERGKQLYEEGSYDAALIEFQRAYELAPSYRILFNIGQVYREQNDYAGALRAYEQYLKDGGREIDTKRRNELEKELSNLRARTATIEIITNEPDAEISIDDLAVGITPLPSSLVVNAGKRKISAAKVGRIPVTKVVTLAGSDSLTVNLELLDPSTQPPPPEPTTSPDASANLSLDGDKGPKRSSAPLIGWVTTGVLAAGAAVTGVIALSSSSSLKDDRDRAGVTRDELDSTRSRVKTTALITDVLIGAAVVAGGVSLYLTLSQPSSPSEQSSAKPFQPGPIRLGVSPGAVMLGGSF